MPPRAIAWNSRVARLNYISGQVSFRAGANPMTNHSAEASLMRMGKTETGPAPSNAGSSPAPGGTDQPIAGGMGGMTSK